MIECPYCKNENRDGVRYCSTCGQLLNPTPTGTNTTADQAARSRAAPSVSRAKVGARLQGGRYVIKKVLGRGGMGAVLLATDLRLDGKPVVIKELISNPATQEEDIANFKREVALLAHIDHPLVPSVTDHFQEGTRYFMVQEYIEGENLEERMKRLNQPTSERTVLLYASEILDVLVYLAQQTPPIVHRDIKPSNIVISNKNRRAHLVDFGIARAAARKQTTALGTPGYSPPEQYQGKADPRSDLYALAATLHYLLTNRDPRNEPPFIYPPASLFNAQVSPEFERVLKRALESDVQQRYQSAAAMKQDIDEILYQRYGIMAGASTYSLSKANTALADNSEELVDIAGTAPFSPPPASGLPVIPSLHTPDGLLAAHTLSGSGLRGMRRRNFLLAVGLLILLLLLIAGGSLFFIRYKPITSQQAGIGITKVGNESIGISDGTAVFDNTLPDAQLKQQAANALKQGNIPEAMSLLSQALTISSNDAEAHIYLEDLRVLNSGDPYVTIVVATMLSGDSGSVQVGRDDLQGAYVAQKEFNDGAKLYNGVKVRLLIASSGSQTDYASRVARQIVQLAQGDKTFMGVMGWPISSRMLAALPILSAAHIPMVSQTASSDALSGSSPYFFRVAPSNKIQGIAGAHYVEQVLRAHNVALFEDPHDPYSSSLAQDFATQFQQDGGHLVATELYTVGQAATLPPDLQDALSKHPDCIYFSGYADDASTLLTDLPPGKIPVMGGDALYELGGYPSSARAGFSRLHFTSFAYPDEWGVLGLSAQQPTFFTSYVAAFDPNHLHVGNPYGFTRADNDAILSYDATVALLHGIDNAQRQAKQNIVTRQQVQQALHHLNGPNSFQGVSGQISFDANGDPIDKSIVILYVDPNGFIKMEPHIEGKFLLGT